MRYDISGCKTTHRRLSYGGLAYSGISNKKSSEEISESFKSWCPESATNLADFACGSTGCPLATEGF
jgi:hypothetical protein